MWQDKISLCFGVADMKFARHPIEENYAKELWNLAKQEDASREDVVNALVLFLETNCINNPEHIKIETAQIQNFFRGRR